MIIKYANKKCWLGLLLPFRGCIKNYVRDFTQISVIFDCFKPENALIVRVLTISRDIP